MDSKKIKNTIIPIVIFMLLVSLVSVWIGKEYDKTKGTLKCTTLNKLEKYLKIQK